MAERLVVGLVEVELVEAELEHERKVGFLGLRGHSSSINSKEGNAREGGGETNMDATLRDDANFIQNVSQFYNQEALSDVILRVGEQRFYAHKFVLAKSSEVFMKMLYEKVWSHDNKEEISLTETAECQAVFDKFLRYLYTAELNISIGTAVGILCLSDKYNVDSLKNLCVAYMVENSRSPKVRNALSWYSWAKALCLQPLIQQCMRTVTWNAQDILNTADWLNMDLEFVCDILQSSELVISNEFFLWEAVVKWLMHESRAEEGKDTAARVLPLIRFPQMQAHQLYELEQCDVASQAECKDQLLTLLSQAYRFRALCPHQGELGVSFNEPYYMPRDYTDLTVDSVRMQNTLRFGIQVDVKVCRGPVPTMTKDGDWKITYRKPQNHSWQLQVYGHETAMLNNAAAIEPTVLLINEDGKVIQVQREPLVTATRGDPINLNINVMEPEIARTLALLIKPVPS